MLKNLTEEQLGSYTCEAGNGYRAHCRGKSVEIRPQGMQQECEIEKNAWVMTGSVKKRDTRKTTLSAFHHIMLLEFEPPL